MSELKELLKDAHISFSLINDEFDYSRSNVSIQYVKSSNTFKIFYPGPNDVGIQSFEFDPDIFNFAFQNSKFKRFTSKFDYLDFDELFFSHYPKANLRVHTLFRFFQITPTVIRKSFSMNHKFKRKLILKLKFAAAKKELGLHTDNNTGFISSDNHIGFLTPDNHTGFISSANNYGLSSADNTNHTGSLNTSPKSPRAIDYEELSRCELNMQLAIKKAAYSCDMNFFDIFLEEYLNKRKCLHLSPHISRMAVDKLFKSFSRLVDNFQNKNFHP